VEIRAKPIFNHVGLQTTCGCSDYTHIDGYGGGATHWPQLPSHERPEELRLKIGAQAN